MNPLADPTGQPAPLETDALVIGAGPVGLFQVFQLGLLEIRAQVVEALPHVGGQCAELYADKPIYDIPGLPRCTGRELVDRLAAQAAPFGAGFHFEHLVESIQRQDDGRFLVGTHRGLLFLARVVIIAAGVGAFVPRRLQLEGVDGPSAALIHYHPNPEALRGHASVVVVGHTEPALSGALALAARGEHEVTLLHRRAQWEASPELLANLQAALDAGAVRFLAGQPLALSADAGGSGHLEVLGSDGQTHRLRVDAIAAYLGLSPRLGPVAHWGLALERKQLVVDTERFETSEGAIFAVGDINTYPGKKKLILCGFHECALAAFGAASWVFPDRATPLQYTTTSTRLHRLLGVQSDPV